MVITQPVYQIIEENKEQIITIAEEILKNPELGYFEEKTSAMVRKVFDDLEISYEYPLAVTGVKATLNRHKDGPNICIIGEMDSLVCKGHPFEGENGEAHACGHHAQIAAMLGAAIGLKKSGILEELGGKITLMAVPAEEFIDLTSRKALKAQGKIEYFGGKQQLFYEGAFRDVDIVMMIHAQTEASEAKFYSRTSNLGFMAKTITFRGKAAHGSRPDEGVNALNAAALAILGIHSNRDTFTEEEHIRIHPIITKGGDVVNSVPDEVCIETKDRGATYDAIRKGSDAVNRAVRGASQMIGTEVTIEDMLGFLPLQENEAINDIMDEVAKEVLGEASLVSGVPAVGSSDIGDVSCVIPTVQPSIGGFSGTIHSKDFLVANPDVAYIGAAKILAATAVHLLKDDAIEAKNIIKNFQPLFTQEEYITYLKKGNI